MYGSTCWSQIGAPRCVSLPERKSKMSIADSTNNAENMNLKEPPFDANTRPGGGHDGKTKLPGSGGEPAQGYMGPTDMGPDDEKQ